jgi:hypothetical protein
MIRIREFHPDDYAPAYSLACNPDLAAFGRFHQLTPSTEEFARYFWRDVQLQYTMADQRGAFVGCISAYGTHSDGYTYINLLSSPARSQGVLPCVGDFVLMVFDRLPVRKIYGELSQFAYSRLRSLDGVCFDVEGVLRAHAFRGGRYEDVYQVAIHRGKHVDEVAATTARFRQWERGRVSGGFPVSVSGRRFLVSRSGTGVG